MHNTLLQLFTVLHSFGELIDVGMRQALVDETRSQKLRARLGSRKTGLSPQYFNTDRSKAVLFLCFLTVTCSCCPYLYFDSAIMLVTYFVNCR